MTQDAHGERPIDYKRRKNISLGIVVGAILPLIGFLVLVLAQPKHIKGQLPIDAYLKVGFGLGVLSALAGVAFIWLWEFQARAARRRAMRALATELGYSYTESTNIPPDLLTTYPLFVTFGHVFRNVQNALCGKVAGRDVCVFDYQHPAYLSSGGSTHAGQIWKFYDTVIVVRGEDSDPHISKYPYGLTVSEVKARIDAIAGDSGPLPAS